MAARVAAIHDVMQDPKSWMAGLRRP